ncbi:hypothetical protein [Parafilimonas sp.]|uniref:hypothetical protein n=1 Tax=Parafilimonas sp. TaxID=1969739 RepID=UPI0039E62653
MHESMGMFEMNGVYFKFSQVVGDTHLQNPPPAGVSPTAVPRMKRKFEMRPMNGIIRAVACL